MHETITTLGVAKIYHDHVFKFRGTPKKVILDCKPQFVSSLTKEFYILFKIEPNLSTAYHSKPMVKLNNSMVRLSNTSTLHKPPTDQLGHLKWLLLAKFVHNQKTLSTTGYSPFQLNYEQQSLISIKQKNQVHSALAQDFVDCMRQTQDNVEHGDCSLC